MRLTKDATSAAEIEGHLSWLDPSSSALWFVDWDPSARPPDRIVMLERARAGARPTCEARTWLARAGWKRAGGALRFDESPAASR